MVMLGADDYLCEACKHFDTDGIDGNHPRCSKQRIWGEQHRAVRLGKSCHGFEPGVPSGYPVSMEYNKLRAKEVMKKLGRVGL